MAGLPAVLSGLRDGVWYQCHDGSLIEPLDAVHLFFPNQGRNATGKNVCFVPQLFTFPSLLDYLPQRTDFFVPEHFVDGLVALVIMTAVITVAMVATKHVWSCLDPRFASIAPSHKQWYVVANCYKAFILAILAVSRRYWVGIYMAYWLDEFMLIALKRSMMVYVATDVVALYMVPKLPRSTILHHIMTAAICIADAGVNISLKGWEGELGVVKMSILYGIFSSFAFPVNAYLALRVVYPKASWMPLLVIVSLVSYILLCVPNWSIHLVWLGTALYNFDFTIATVAYMVAMCAMVHDDLVLIKWLIRRSSPMASNVPKEDASE